MTDWKRHSVADLISKNRLFIGDGYRAKIEEFSSSGLPFARVSNINDGFDFKSVDYFPEKDLSKVGNKISEPADAVFTSKGTVGRFAFVTPDIQRFVYSPQLCFWRVLDTNIIDPRFLFFWMSSREFFLQFNGVKGQTDMADYVSLADQRRMLITLPPLPEQRAIAGILGALDDKIELNRRMNRTLESMARTVFRQWFVQNEKVESRTVSRLGDTCEFVYGKSLKEEDRQAGAVPVYGSNGQIGWHSKHLVKGPGIVVGRKGNPGIVTWAQNDFFAIDTTFYIIPKKPSTSLYWLYYTLISLNLPDLGADSAVPGLNRNIAYMSDVHYPSESLMKKFDSFVIPIFDKIDANEKESRTLASLRDTLLPKLMSGEVRVP